MLNYISVTQFSLNKFPCPINLYLCNAEITLHYTRTHTIPQHRHSSITPGPFFIICVVVVGVCSLFPTLERTYYWVIWYDLIRFGRARFAYGFLPSQFVSGARIFRLHCTRSCSIDCNAQVMKSHSVFWIWIRSLTISQLSLCN